MLDIISEIPQANRAEIKANLLAKMPNNETIPDPAWVDPQDGTKAPQIPRFPNDADHIEEEVFQWLKRQNRKGKKILAKATVSGDDDIRAT